MPDYGNYCPIAIATDVIADRWTPLILRELVLGNTRFNDIARGLPGISRSLLVQRLKHLERKGVIETWPLPNGRGSEYHLTPAGKDLEPVLIVMGRWSVAWMYSNLDCTDVDAVTLMWWMHRRVDVEPPAARAGGRPVRPHRPEALLVLGRDRAGRGVGLPAGPRLRRSTPSSRARRPRSPGCSAASTRGGRPWTCGDIQVSGTQGGGQLDAALVPLEPVGERDAAVTESLAAT